MDVTNDGEVELNLPRETPGATALGMTMTSQEERHRLGPDRNGPDTDCHFRVWRIIVVQPWELWGQPWELRGMWVVSERIRVGWEPRLRGPGGQQPEDGTTVDSNFYATGRDKSVDPDRRDQPHAARGRQDLPWSPDTALMDMVACLQRDLNDMRAESRYLRTRGGGGAKFVGVTSWEQYLQVFDAIVLSNGWDDVTAALQLLSHLEGDALNVALLVPASRRASRVGLVGALSTHYGLPGRLADYQRQFEKTTRTSGEDLSIFATTLETLAIKAFGDMGQTERLCIICDRFIAGQTSCELHRHLDSVPPETPPGSVLELDPKTREEAKRGSKPPGSEPRLGHWTSPGHRQSRNNRKR